jgi:hypothetical protein
LTDLRVKAADLEVLGLAAAADLDSEDFGAKAAGSERLGSEAAD